MLSAGVVAWQEACAGSRRIENRSGTIKVEGKSEQDGKRERERESDLLVPRVNKLDHLRQTVTQSWRTGARDTWARFPARYFMRVTASERLSRIARA